MGFPGGSVVKNPSTRQCRRQRFDHSVGKTPGGGNGNPVQYSCLGNPMDREAWWATVHVGYSSCKSWRRLSDQTTSRYYLCPKNFTAYNLFLAYILKNKYIQIKKIFVMVYNRVYIIQEMKSYKEETNRLEGNGFFRKWDRLKERRIFLKKQIPYFGICNNSNHLQHLGH